MCFWVHVCIYSSGYMSRIKIKGSHNLHISTLTLIDANLPSARSIQLMFIKIEELFVTTGSTRRSLKSPGVRV